MIFYSSMRQRTFLKFLHNSDSSGHHSPPQVLNNVKSINNNLSRWKKFFNERNVALRHVHSYDLDLITDSQGVLVEIVFDGGLLGIFKYGHQFLSLKILSDEG